MSHFWNRERKQGKDRGVRVRHDDHERMSLFPSDNPCKIGSRQHAERDMAIPSQETAHFVVVQPQIFAVLKIFFNGLITNDKFCMSRTTQLQFSWWRFPRKARQTISDDVESSVKGNIQHYLPQQERHEETTMEHSALLRADA